MSIFYTDKITTADYAVLETAVGWEFNPEQLEACINGSAYVTAAYECPDGATADNQTAAKIIGAARIVWDFGDDAFLKDVAVLPQYQGRGVGRELILRVINFLNENIKEGWGINLDLIAANGRSGFYEKLGFGIQSSKDGGTAHMRLHITK
jgi:GNAT superfamily N-acetyltransferase